MATTLKQVACVNCNLLTREDQLLCLNDSRGVHRRDVRESLRNESHATPTAEDRESYFLWLSQQGTSEMIH